jgi:Zn finger protein HypA/HybF involved in hydrogenase expression
MPGGVEIPLRYEPIYRDEVPHRARSLFDSGLAYLARGDTEAAKRSFRDAVDVAPEFVDAHLYLAQIESDPSVKREHVSAVIAYDPGNLDALRMIMVLNGELTPEAAERVRTDHHPVIRRADRPVRTSAQTLICPACGGHMGIDEDDGEPICRFCGSRPATADKGTNNLRVLGTALIARKAQAERWITDERLLRCHRCGAEHILPLTVLSLHCPFCGSAHVIERDAVGSFTKPDGMIPFALTEQDAAQAIKRALETLAERLMAFFDDNRVKSGVINGAYLPFWLFDATLSIARIVRRGDDHPLLKQRGAHYTPPVEERFTDGLFNLPVAASKSLPPDTLRKIADYEYDAIQAYDPMLLAHYPASLYDIDFDNASLTARGAASQLMRVKHGGTDLDGDQAVSVSASVQSMMFSLVLLPVFIANLTERDGDQRTALVNGQTGTVALGRVHKPSR